MYEVVVGDFWLDMRPIFFEEIVYVPFKDGKIITNKKEWGFYERIGKKEPVILCNIQRGINFLLQLIKWD